MQRIRPSSSKVNISYARVDVASDAVHAFYFLRYIFLLGSAGAYSSLVIIIDVFLACYRMSESSSSALILTTGGMAATSSHGMTYRSSTESAQPHLIELLIPVTTRTVLCL